MTGKIQVSDILETLHPLSTKAIPCITTHLSRTAVTYILSPVSTFALQNRTGMASEAIFQFIPYLCRYDEWALMNEYYLVRYHC